MGFLPTMSHMGVKQPVAPPPAQPIPPACNITWVFLVPVGTRRMSSKSAKILGIKKYMTGLNWKRGHLSGCHDGVKGVYLAAIEDGHLEKKSNEKKKGKRLKQVG